MCTEILIQQNLTVQVVVVAYRFQIIKQHMCSHILVLHLNSSIVGLDVLSKIIQSEQNYTNKNDIFVQDNSLHSPSEKY